jgi:CrcB protein
MDVAFGEIFMLAYLWVAIGGALGSMARFWINGFVTAWFGETAAVFPLGTLIINVTGSFVIGIFAALTAPDISNAHRATLIQFFMIGICGGYTTFSSFSLQTLNLLRDREWLYAGGNVMLSVVLCMVAVWLGYLLGMTFNSMKGN